MYQNVGMLIARQTTETTGNFCRRCIRKYVASYSLTTFVLGWWGMISAIITPFLLIANLIVYLRSLGMSEPDLLAAGIAPGMPVPGPELGSQKWKVAVAAGIVVVLVGVVAYNSTEFMETHFPKVNAALHGGEISAGSDAEYAGMQIAKDINGLQAPLAKKEWAEMRSEYLAREPYLNDLRVQNTKLQRAIEQERAQGISDQCEKLSADEFLPALNEYTSAVNQTFTLWKAAPERTDQTAADLNTSFDAQDTARAHMATYFSDSKKRGCDRE